MISTSFLAKTPLRSQQHVCKAPTCCTDLSGHCPVGKQRLSLGVSLRQRRTPRAQTDTPRAHHQLHYSSDYSCLPPLPHYMRVPPGGEQGNHSDGNRKR